MKREAFRAVALCAMVCVSAYLLWACFRIEHVFDSGWPRGLPYPDRFMDAWAGWVLSYHGQTYFYCGHNLLWAIRSAVYCLCGITVWLSLMLGRPFAMRMIRFAARPGQCRKCYYDVSASLAAFSTHCPECGHQIDPTEVLKQRADTWEICNRFSCRALIVTLLHWSLLSGMLVTIQFAKDPMYSYAREINSVLSFPISYLSEHMPRLGREFMLLALVLLNSLLWGSGISLVLEWARTAQSRIQKRVSRFRVSAFSSPEA